MIKTNNTKLIFKCVKPASFSRSILRDNKIPFVVIASFFKPSILLMFLIISTQSFPFKTYFFKSYKAYIQRNLDLLI